MLFDQKNIFFFIIQVSEIKMQKEAEKQNKDQEPFYDIPKCNLHPQKPSSNCR